MRSRLASYDRPSVMVRTVFDLAAAVLRFVVRGLRSHARMAAENLFLRKQSALYLEREMKPRRVTNATRLTLVVLARFIEWRQVLTIVQPDMLVRWHRHAFGGSGVGSLGTGDVRGFHRCSSV
jgi:putative transposase